MLIASISYDIVTLESMLRKFYEALSYAPTPEASVALLAAIAWIVMVLAMLYKFLK